MGDQGAHLARAEDSFKAAEALCREFPAWALVPLFYSAMHYVHAACDRDELQGTMRHPEKHNSHWRDGARVWGTTDVVAAQYCPVSVAYKSLLQASHFARYNVYLMLRSGLERFWDEHARLKRDLGY